MQWQPGHQPNPSALPHLHARVEAGVLLGVDPSACVAVAVLQHRRMEKRMPAEQAWQ